MHEKNWLRILLMLKNPRNRLFVLDIALQHHQTHQPQLCWHWFLAARSRFKNSCSGSPEISFLQLFTVYWSQTYAAADLYDIGCSIIQVSLQGKDSGERMV